MRECSNEENKSARYGVTFLVYRWDAHGGVKVAFQKRDNIWFLGTSSERKGVAIGEYRCKEDGIRVVIKWITARKDGSVNSLSRVALTHLEMVWVQIVSMEGRRAVGTEHYVDRRKVAFAWSRVESLHGHVQAVAPKLEGASANARVQIRAAVLCQ